MCVCAGLCFLGAVNGHNGNLAMAYIQMFVGLIGLITLVMKEVRGN